MPPKNVCLHFAVLNFSSMTFATATTSDVVAASTISIKSVITSAAAPTRAKMTTPVSNQASLESLFQPITTLAAQARSLLLQVMNNRICPLAKLADLLVCPQPPFPPTERKGYSPCLLKFPSHSSEISKFNRNWTSEFSAMRLPCQPLNYW